MMRITLIASLFVLLAGCTAVPEQIQGTFAEVSPARVDESVFGTQVRWGGVILETRNRENRSCFEILSRELDRYLRPVIDDRTAGRFIACKPGFHDPAVFAKGRELTVTGHIRTITVRRVDDFDYRYPLLDVEHLVLWEKRKNVVVYRHHYDPWGWHYPYGYWGWGHPYYRPLPGHHHGQAEVRTLLPDPSIIDSQPATPHD